VLRPGPVDFHRCLLCPTARSFMSRTHSTRAKSEPANQNAGCGVL
jgi:hypothetical protein